MTTEITELRELRVLQAFKERLPRADLGENVSPFDDRVVTTNDQVARFDLADVHSELRRHIAETIRDVHNRQKSQVILLAGDAGTGKTHLLQTFRAAERAEEQGYVFVGGANHWKVSEFEARLLDWVIEALTAPTPKGDHLLLDRIRAIGFRALDHLLDSAGWGQFVARPRAGWLGRQGWRIARQFGIGRGPSHDTLAALASARDPAVFRLLDMTSFSGYVCDRFLADKSNPNHRYALQVLLTYLFPPDEDTGVGYRERVTHWFRRRPDDGYFIKRLGVDNPLERRFMLFDAVKLLSHLFSPAVSKELATEKFPCRPRVLLLTFDQAEGRNELFESPQDWTTFFAQLSELYSTLPNSLVIFTMTLALRSQLHTRMERQFRDRIRMDDRFKLSYPTPGQILELYRTRIEFWIGADPLLLGEYSEVGNRYIPFSAETISGNVAAQPRAIREVLETLDCLFRQALQAQAIEPRLDFLVALNEEMKAYQTGKQAPGDNPNYDHNFTSGHLELVASLLRAFAAELIADRGMRLREVRLLDDYNPEALGLEFEDIKRSGITVWVHLVRFGFFFNDPAQRCVEQHLKGKQVIRYFLWRVRAAPWSAPPEEKYMSRVCDRDFPAELDARLRALLCVIRNKPRYVELGQWPVAMELILKEVAGCYIGELLQDTRSRLDALHSKPELTAQTNLSPPEVTA